MVQISEINREPFWNMVPGRVRKIPPPSPPLSKDETLKDIGHIVSIGNLILDVNSDSYYMRQLLQNATFITNYSV